MVPFGVEFEPNYLALFLDMLLEKLSPKERAALIKQAGLTRAEVGAAQKLGPAAKKLERTLKGAKLTKPSVLFQVLAKAPGEQVLYLAVNSAQRIVQDRIKNYFQKYLPLADEVTDEMVAETGVTPGTPKFRKAKEEMVLAKLDARPKKVAPPPEPPPPPTSGFQRGAGLRRAQQGN